MDSILIIEAGATKTDVVFTDDADVHQIQLPGINPVANPGSEVFLDRLPSNGHKVKEIYYYGAGVRNEEIKSLLQSKLAQLFDGVRHINIADDLQAAANAVNFEGQHIVSILGTGSSSGIFDGVQLIQKLVSPGYLFGDEGSAYAAGKLILQSYLMHEMDSETKQAFEDFHSATAEQILKSVYESQHPNKTIADSARFLNGAPRHFKSEILNSCFRSFFEKRIMRLANEKQYKLSFTGSMAHHYKTALIEAASKHGFQVGSIIEKPLDGLVKYHRKIKNERDK